MRDGTLYWIWLAQKLGAGNRYLPYLMERYSDAFEVYRADSEELFDTEMPEALQEALSDKNLDEALAISDYCTRLRIGILTYKSELYPAGLRRLKDPPTVLYYRGRMPDLSKMVSISVVGTRTMSEYGKGAGYKIAYELASAGVCIVSGMALGVDSVAACAALEAGNTTIAVLGSGVDVIYPKEHTTLYKKIIERGAVISEYPPTTRPEGRNFPQRNRIISGLGMGTIVIEGDMRSGALITAECALEQGKDLFALPGNIDSANASGTNALLRNGADLVLEASDVLNRYSLYHANKLDFANLTRAKARSSVNDEVLLRYGVHLDAGREEKTEPVRRTPVKRDEAPKQSEKLENIAESSAHIKEPAVTDTKVLDQLPEKYRDIFGAIPDGRPVSFDEVLAVCKTPGEAMSALTFLEIKGAVSSLPGGYYLKN